MTLFDTDTRIITADFKAPSVKNRLKKLGFGNISTVGEDETAIDGLVFSSYIAEELSHDDATYLIRGSDGAVIHTNDNWRAFEQRHEELIKKRISSYSPHSVLLFTQTNSASGYPLNYTNFTEDEKTSILRSKAAHMTEAGLRKAERLNLPRIFSYAGFASPCVKGKKYESESLFPTAAFLRKLLSWEGIESSVEIEDFYPGDHLELPEGGVVKAFASGYSDPAIERVTKDFHLTYGNRDGCLSYRSLKTDESVLEKWLEDFLNEFSRFTAKRIEGPDTHLKTASGKTLSIEAVLEKGNTIRKTARLGTGITEYDPHPNKHCSVNASILSSILRGEALFEDLYTGYHGEWRRNPPDVYNRDIIILIVMFSYVYKNRLAEKYRIKYG